MTDPTETPAPANLRPSKFVVCVDHREESRVALRLACLKARRRGGTVAILHVIQPADFQTLHAIADKMSEERRQEAETLLQSLAAEALALSGTPPSLILREGPTGDSILAAAMEDPDASMLVVGVAVQNNNRGKLVGWLAGQVAGRLLIPLLLVPGNLTDQQIQSLI